MQHQRNLLFDPKEQSVFPFLEVNCNVLWLGAVTQTCERKIIIKSFSSKYVTKTRGRRVTLIKVGNSTFSPESKTETDNIIFQTISSIMKTTDKIFAQ